MPATARLEPDELFGRLLAARRRGRLDLVRACLATLRRAGYGVVAVQTGFRLVTAEPDARRRAHG